MTQPTAQGAAPKMDTTTRLAFQRTFIAFERTQMAWARTALSLISFGFAVSNVFAALHANEEGEPPYLTAHAVGTIMIVLGLLSLAMGGYENRIAMNQLRSECPGLPRSMATLLSIVLAVLGFVALASVNFRR